MDTNRLTDTGRRRFLKRACSAGMVAAAGSVGLGKARGASGGEETAAMPLRPLGRTGVQVPILGLGGSLNLMNRQLLLAQALKWG